MEGWGGVAITAVTSATGNLTQLYPNWATAGAVKSSATNGQQIRGVIEGVMYSFQLQTDGINGGTIEIWDVNGDDAGADVSSLTAITNAQLVALQARGLAKLIYSQNFEAAPVTFLGSSYRGFQRGLAARYVGDSGATCSLSPVVQGGYRYTTKVG